MKVVQRPELTGTQRFYLGEVLKGLFVTISHVLRNLMNPKGMPVIFFPNKKKTCRPPLGAATA